MSYLYNSSSSSLTQTNHTLNKCQKILRMFQQIGDDDDVGVRYNSNVNDKIINPMQRSSSKHAYNPYYISQPSAKKSNSNYNSCNKNNKPNHTITNKPSNLHRSSSKSTIKNNLTTNTSSSFFTNQQPHNHQSTTLSSSKNKHNTSTFYNNNNKHRQSSIMMKREKSNSSFVSCYNKQSRLDKIMKLKVSKPNITTSMAGIKQNKKTMILNTSLSSLNSSRSSLNNKENIHNNNRHKQSRLEKIMNIKVEKPKVNSTLKNYQPRKLQRSLSKSLSKNKKSLNNITSVLELKDCKKKQRKSQQIQQKQQRLWKLFERERQQQLKDKKRQQEQYYKQQRRQQQKFEKLVQKQLRKIQNGRQLNLRKQKAFCQYVYPSY